MPNPIPGFNNKASVITTTAYKLARKELGENYSDISVCNFMVGYIAAQVVELQQKYQQLFEDIESLLDEAQNNCTDVDCAVSVIYEGLVQVKKENQNG